jgi:aldehyde:ferredoxin oxidoreductase
MKHGYMGKLLFIDLTTGKISTETPPEKMYREYIGGTGLGVRILYERMPPGADPLGPDNILGFVTGPLTATDAPGAGRFTVVTKSPLTGTWADSNSGGYWGSELKYAGYDAIFFSGVASKPVYLSIIEGKVELKNASHLWGKNTRETDQLLKKEVDNDEVKISCIGPAGESMSLLSGIVNEDGRIAARSGVGAVMGSKRLKAVVVKGSKKVSVALPDQLKAAKSGYLSAFKKNPIQTSISKYGTGADTSMLVSIGDSPIKNWTETGLEAMPTCEKLNSSNMEPYKVKGYGCHKCASRCSALIEVNEGSYPTEGPIHRPEYETLAAFGGNCFNDDVESVIKSNEICNLYGIDTMGVGSAISFAMECWDKGLITAEDTSGLDLTWGNSKSIVALTEQICKREGFGAVFSDGSRKAAEKLGKGTEQYAMHVRGQDLPFHDPRFTPLQGTVYFADANPGRHMDSCVNNLLQDGVPLGDDPALSVPQQERWGEYHHKGALMSVGVPFNHFYSSAGMCAVLLIGNSVPVVEYMAAVTGWDMDGSEAIKAGKRITTLRQAFNVREGLKPEDFKLPERFSEPLAAGPATGETVDFEAIRTSYYTSMGWEPTSGMPQPEVLKELGIDTLVILE